MQGKFILFFIILFQAALAAQTIPEQHLEKSGKYLNTQFDSSIIFAERAVKANTQNDALINTRAYKNIGLANYYKGNYPLALEHYQKAIRLAEANKFNKELVSLYNLFGTFYKKQNKTELALASFENELRLATEIKDSSFMASALNDIGLVHQLNQKPQIALDHYTRALNIYESINDSIGMSYSLNYLSEVYANDNKFDLAIEVLNKALKIRQNLNDEIATAININNIGEVYLLKKDYSNALHYFSVSLEMAKKKNVAELVKHIYKMMSEIYLQQHDFKKAYEYFALHTAVKDSIYNDRNARVVNELEGKYQLEKKQQQIELLSKDQKVKEVEVKNQKLIRNTLIVSSCIIILLAFYRARIKQKANEKLSNAYHIIEEKNKDITDSIKYAQRIQRAILPGDKAVKNLLTDSFVLYLPKDIVSGDFYWVEQLLDSRLKTQESGPTTLIAAVDCTGHGVPGAFMSIVAHNLLNQAVKEKHKAEPAEILNEVNRSLQETLKKEATEVSVNDGMDIALIALNPERNSLQYAGANNPLWIVKNKMLKEIKADKFPIGQRTGDLIQSYTNHQLRIDKGDMLYIFTDGYADQFGGEKGKKFKYRKLNELLATISDKPVEDQKQILYDTIIQWKGKLEQVDDICIIGIRV